MRIEELSDIVKLADLKAITKEMKRLGYINCSDQRQLEKIGIVTLINSIVLRTEDIADSKGKYIYSGHICGTIAGYEKYEFIIINVYYSKPSADPLDKEKTVLETEMHVWATVKEEE